MTPNDYTALREAIPALARITGISPQLWQDLYHRRLNSEWHRLLHHVMQERLDQMTKHTIQARIRQEEILEKAKADQARRQKNWLTRSWF
jgi:hypothetical protein